MHRQWLWPSSTPGIQGASGAPAKCTEAVYAVQCLTDGKSIIMEGMHLDPGLYLYEFARYSQAHLTERMRGRKSLRNQEPGSVSPEQGVAARCMPSGTAAAEAAIVRSKDDLRCVMRCLFALP